MKKILLFLLVLVSLPIVLADWSSNKVCLLNDLCSISVFTVNHNNHEQLRDATCTIRVYNTSESLIVNNASMVRNSLGHYHYLVNTSNATFNVSGYYHSLITCTNNSGSDGVSIVSSGTAIETNPTLDGDNMMFDFIVDVEDVGDDWMLAVLLPILAVIGVFAYFSIRMNQLHYFIKVLLFLGSLSLTIVAVNIGRIIVEENSPASTGLISLLNTASFVLIILLIVITAYLIIYYIAELLWGIANTKIGKTP